MNFQIFCDQEKEQIESSVILLRENRVCENLLEYISQLKELESTKLPPTTHIYLEFQGEEILDVPVDTVLLGTPEQVSSPGQGDC